MCGDPSQAKLGLKPGSPPAKRRLFPAAHTASCCRARRGIWGGWGEARLREAGLRSGRPGATLVPPPALSSMCLEAQQAAKERSRVSRASSAIEVATPGPDGEMASGVSRAPLLSARSPRDLASRRQRHGHPVHRGIPVTAQEMTGRRPSYRSAGTSVKSPRTAGMPRREAEVTLTWKARGEADSTVYLPISGLRSLSYFILKTKLRPRRIQSESREPISIIPET